MANIDGLNPSFRAALMGLVNASGGKINIQSGFRTYAEQEKLYSAYKAGKGNLAAKPGTSNHESGFAADLGGDLNLAHRLAPQFGLTFPINGEGWHVELSGGKAAAGAGGGNKNVPDFSVTTAPPTQAAAPDPMVASLGVLHSMLGGSDDSSSLPNADMPDLTTSNSLPNLGNPIVADPQPQQQQKFVQGSANAGLYGNSGGSGGGGGGTASGKFADLFNQAGAKYGIDPRLLSAVARAESGYNPNAGSAAGAKGLMQFMPATARGLGVDPMNPASAVDGAARMLSGLIKQFGSTEKALAAYNAGAGAVQKYGGIPPYKETQNYVKRIMGYIGNG